VRRLVRELEANTILKPTLPRRHMAPPWNGREGPDDARLWGLAEDAASLGHWHFDVASDKLTLSEQVFRICGRDPTKFKSTPQELRGFVHPDDLEKVVATLRAAVDAGRSFEFDYRLTRPDGEIRSVICRGQPEYGEDGKLVGLFGVITDVTEAFAAIRSIQDQNEMLDLAAELAHLGHWVWNKESDRLAYCSEHLARIYDLAPATFLSRFPRPDKIAPMLVEEDRQRYIDVVNHALANGEPYRTDYRVTAPRNTVKYLREIGQPIFDYDEKLVRYIATVQDVTEATLREHELEEAKRGLEALNLQKDKLFSIIAHDLRSPFNSVIGFADLLASKSHELSPGKVASYAQIVREAASGVHDLLDNLLAWASYQIRDDALKLAPVNLQNAAAAALEPLMHMAEAKRVTIVNGISGIDVMGDEPLLRIVFRNLVSNGIKFSRTGGMVQVTAEPAPEVAGMVRITVRDNGVGISGASPGNLFELGRGMSATGTRGEKGTGLGLYLCRDIVARHGGGIWADEACSDGAAFHFTLPAPN